jgi:hypothetical protein
MWLIPIINVDDLYVNQQTPYNCWKESYKEENKPKRVIQMTRNLLGNPQLTVTDVNDVKEGLNHIVVVSADMTTGN